MVYDDVYENPTSKRLNVADLADLCYLSAFGVIQKWLVEKNLHTVLSYTAIEPISFLFQYTGRNCKCKCKNCECISMKTQVLLVMADEKFNSQEQRQYFLYSSPFSRHQFIFLNKIHFQFFFSFIFFPKMQKKRKGKISL